MRPTTTRRRKNSWIAAGYAQSAAIIFGGDAVEDYMARIIALSLELCSHIEHMFEIDLDAEETTSAVDCAKKCKATVADCVDTILAQ